MNAWRLARRRRLFSPSKRIPGCTTKVGKLPNDRSINRPVLGFGNPLRLNKDFAQLGSHVDGLHFDFLMSFSYSLAGSSRVSGLLSLKGLNIAAEYGLPWNALAVIAQICAAMSHLSSRTASATTSSSRSVICSQDKPARPATTKMSIQRPPPPSFSGSLRFAPVSSSSPVASSSLIESRSASPLRLSGRISG